jgi:anthranilate phosphoribosyltransferase
VLATLIPPLAQARNLNLDEVNLAVRELIDPLVPATLKAEFLTALAQKGETVQELTAFARALRAQAVPVPVDAATRARAVVDVCGTGGDRLHTFNVSTTVALLVAAGGVTVAKHGNRAVTSRSGSADVLEALGVRIDLAPAEAAAWLAAHRFAFLFAPAYHPAFKHIAPARRLCAERGQPTLFNFLGPLLNPAHPTAQLIGVPRPELCEPLARVLQALGVRRGMVVCGAVAAGGASEPDAFLDELSTLGQNTIAEFHQDHALHVSTLTLESFPVQPAVLADLAGGEREANARVTRSILQGEERGPKRDAVLLNAAAALFLAGVARSMAEGWDVAAGLLDGGQARAKLEELVVASRPGRGRVPG